MCQLVFADCHQGSEPHGGRGVDMSLFSTWASNTPSTGEAVELRLALPDEQVLAVVGQDTFKLIKKRKSHLTRCKVDVLKTLIKLYNTIHDLRPRSADYIKTTGKKDELLESVESFLYKEVESTPTSPPPSSVLQKRTLPESASSPYTKLPRSASPAPPLAPRGNAIVPPKLERPTWWEGDKEHFYRSQSPFWKEEAQLEVIFIDPRIDQNHYPFYYREHAFSVLNADDLSAIQTGKKTIHLRLYHKHNRNDYEWIQAHDLQINRQPALVVRKKTRTAPVKQPFVIPPPIMISAANIKSRNRFSFNCPREFYGYLVVQLVSPRSIEEIMDSVPTITHSGSNRSGDDDLAEVSLKVGVRCPLSFTRIEKPARGVNCTHIQCFDLESYLAFCQQQSIWYCSICYRSLPPPDLRRDEYFQSILDYVGDDDSDDDIKVEINEDGTFQKSSLVSMPEHQSAPAPPPAPAASLTPSGSQAEESREESQSDSQPASMNTGSIICILDSDSEDEAPREAPSSPSPPPFTARNPMSFRPDSTLFTSLPPNLGSTHIVSLSSDSEDDGIGW